MELFRSVLGDERSVGDACSAEHPAVTLNFIGRSECLGIVVGKLHGGPSLHVRHLADQADGIESGAVIRIAASKVIGEQGAPSGADPNTAARGPLRTVMEIR